jgi:hypothetical protein
MRNDLFPLPLGPPFRRCIRHPLLFFALATLSLGAIYVNQEPTNNAEP